MTVYIPWRSRVALEEIKCLTRDEQKRIFIALYTTYLIWGGSPSSSKQWAKRTRRYLCLMCRICDIDRVAAKQWATETRTLFRQRRAMFESMLKSVSE
jgi:hypothetical protein